MNNIGRSFMQSAICLLTLSFSQALAVDWQTVYSTDFSSDPGWTTNSSSRYYWNSTAETYYSEQIAGSGEYSYKVLPDLQSGWSWRFEYDIRVSTCGAFGDNKICLVGSDLAVFGGSAMIALDLTDVNHIALQWTDTAGDHSANLGAFEFDVWYTGRVEWGADIGALYARVVRRDGGSLVGETTRTSIPGTFNGIDRIAMSTVGDDYEPTDYGTCNFDNIVVSQTPEPAAISLLALGGLALIRRRRK